MAGIGAGGHLYGNHQDAEVIHQGAIIYPNLPLRVEKQNFGFSSMKCPKCSGVFSGKRQMASGYKISSDIYFHLHYMEHESYCQDQPINEFSWLVRGCSTNAECRSLIRGNIWAILAVHSMGDAGIDSRYISASDSDVNQLRNRIQAGEKIPHATWCECLGITGLFSMIIMIIAIIFP